MLPANATDFADAGPRPRIRQMTATGTQSASVSESVAAHVGRVRSIVPGMRLLLSGRRSDKGDGLATMPQIRAIRSILREVQPIQAGIWTDFHLQSIEGGRASVEIQNGCLKQVFSWAFLP